MGSCVTRPKEPNMPLNEDADGSSHLKLLIHFANRVPTKSACSQSHAYVRVQLDSKPRQTAVRSLTCKGTQPVWDEVVALPCDLVECYNRDENVRITLVEKEYCKPDSFIGQAVISFRALVKRPSITLLMSDRNGDAVNCGSPPAPCELSVSVVSEGNVPWPMPKVRPNASYPKHVMMISRGTRGDVQPFAALAIGMAEQLGWLVTICTELRWRAWLKDKTSALSRGAVRFVPSGGDTEKRMNIWVAQNVMFQAR